MKIEKVRANLRNIVLLAREYRENIPISMDEEIKQLKAVVKHEYEGPESYNGGILDLLKKERRRQQKDTFRQIIHFLEKALLQFATKKSEPRFIEIQGKKADNARKVLTKREIDLLSTMYSIYLSLSKTKWYNNSEYDPKKARKLIKEDMIDLIDHAIKIRLETLEPTEAKVLI